MTATRLEPASLAHAALLAEMHARCFDDAWSARAMGEVLSSPGAFATIAVAAASAGEAGSPAGFALARTASDEAELITLCVLPELRRGGLAKTLLDDALRDARRRGARAMFLEVAENNHAAQALYLGRGFAAVGRRPDYYVRPNMVPVAALVLRRSLPEA